MYAHTTERAKNQNQEWQKKKANTYPEPWLKYTERSPKETLHYSLISSSRQSVSIRYGNFPLTSKYNYWYKIEESRVLCYNPTPHTV